MPLIVQSTKQNTTSFNLAIIKSHMQTATNNKATLAETKVAIVHMYQNGTTAKLSPQAQKAAHALANYIYVNKESKKFAFVLGKDHQDQQLLLLTISNHPATPQAKVSLLKVIRQVPTSTQKQEDPSLVKQLSWVTKALHKVEFGILFWIYQHRLSSQEALLGTKQVPPSITAVNFQRVKTAHEQLQDQAWAKMMQVVHKLTSSQLGISVNAQQLPSQTKIAESHIMLAIQKIITNDDAISIAASKLMKADNIEVQPDDKTGAIMITIKNYGNDKIITIFGFKATSTPREVAQAKIDAAQNKIEVTFPTRLNQVLHGQIPLATDVNAPIKHGVTFKFKSAIAINNKGKSTLTYEIDVDPQVDGTTPQDVTFVVSGFETQVQAVERITAQAKIKAAQNKIKAAQNKIKVIPPTRLSQVFHGQMPIASNVNVPTKDGMTFKFKKATAIDNEGESTLTYEVDVDPQVEGTKTKDVTFIVSGFETKAQKDAREVIKKRLDTIIQKIRDGALVIPKGITSSQFDVYVQAMGVVYDRWGNFVMTKFVEQYRDKIISLTIPTSFTTIGTWFQGFKKITSLRIPNAVTAIGAYAFQNSPLTSLALGNQLKTIGYQAFLYAKLKSLTIPNAVTAIGAYAFQNSPLTSLALGNQLQTIRLFAFYGARLTSLTIPDAVTTIGTQAFGHAPLTSLALGDQLQTIGGSAFLSAKLKSLTIPNAVTAIGAYAFQDSPLTSLALGNQLQTIGVSAFLSAKLKSLTIPNAVTTIGAYAFHISPLTSLSLGNQLQTIGGRAFLSAKLKSLIIPNAVTTIGTQAFFNSPLTNVKVFEGVSLGKDAFKSAIKFEWIKKSTS